MKTHKPKSIKEAINDLQDFLECDLYSKFRPAQTLPIGKDGKDETWYRQDVFPNEKEFVTYIDDHFDILRKQIVKIIGKEKYKNEM